jgi:uncharacterized protein YfcZ (UPF0381/DUF406 family)
MRSVMKVLFLDQSAELQQKFIFPLRNEGWGALRASSVEDADRMMILHGDGVEAIVVNEKFANWPKRWDLPYIVLTQTWRETEILKHQNAEHAAIAYVAFAKSTAQSLVSTFHARMSGELKATGTGHSSSHGGSLSLENFSGVMARPEISLVKQGTSSIVLEAPSVLMGGTLASSEMKALTPADITRAATSVKIEMESPSPHTRVISTEFRAEAQSEIKLEPKTELKLVELELSHSPYTKSTPAQDAGDESYGHEEDAGNKTVVLDATQFEMPEVKAVDFSSSFNESTSASLEISLSSEEPNYESEAPSQYHYDQRATPRASSEPASYAMNSAAPAYLPMNTAAAAMAAIGSGASASDIETLRSYLALREQDVAVLTGQMRSSHDRIQQLEMQVKLERARANELQHLVQKQEQTIKNYDQDKQVDIEVLYKQVEDLNLQLKERTDKARSIESKLKFTLEEVQKVKDRVRVDIRRIRVREKELENQLEILKKDSSSLLLARDEKIIELKRKIDLLEFNMELVQEQYGKERHIAEQLRARLKDAVGVMRQAGGLLDLEQ